MKGQKERVVELVKTELGSGFIACHHVALNMLNESQLERIKLTVGQEIVAGQVEYGKDRSNTREVMAYARSMVMNHLKKAKELNGGQVSKTASAARGNNQASSGSSATKTFKGINMELLPEELKDYVASLST